MPITYPHFAYLCTIQLNGDRPAAETWYHVILQGQAKSGGIKSKLWRKKGIYILQDIQQTCTNDVVWENTMKWSS